MRPSLREGSILAVRQTATCPRPLRHQGGALYNSCPFYLFARAAYCAAVLSTGAVSGCMTTFEARRTRASVATIRARLDALENVDGEHAKQIPQLNRTLEEAQSLLITTADNTAAKENRLDGNIADLQAWLDKLAETVARGIRERTEARDRIAKRLAGARTDRCPTVREGRAVLTPG